MCRPTFHTARRLASVALVALLSATSWATVTQAAVPWHSSLEQAKAAAAISRRPVLLVFGASWSDASVVLHEKTLANPEASAIITACFEPVKIDVDVDPAMTKKMGVTYLPTACVVDQDDRVLTSFDCPDSPASFVAAAGKAVQDAAAARQSSVTAVTVPAGSSQPVAAVAAPAPAAPPVVQSAATPPAAGAAIAVPPAAVPESTANRPLSRFSSDGSAAPAQESRWAPESPTASLPMTMPEAATRAPWAPTPATQSPTVTTAARPAIEPAPAQPPTGPSGMASWLGDSAAQRATTATYGATVPQPAPQSQPAQAPPAPAVATYGSTPLPPSPASPAQKAAAAGQSGDDKPKSSNAFLAALQRPFSFFSSTPKVEKAEPTTPPAVPAAAQIDPYGTMPLGMEGYCPVTLAEKGQWVEGRAQWGARHRGRTYLFAGEPQQRAFLADPDRYAPALSGDDPVVAFDGGKSVPGQRRYGVTYQSRIYLFSTPETRTTFSSNPQRYTARVAVAENPSSQTGTILR